MRSSLQTQNTRSLLLRNGMPFYYRVRTDELIVSAISQSIQASIFFTEYTSEYSDSKRQRPCVFCWNGGPGDSSMWLHLGSIGPKRIVHSEIADNPETLLRFCDLIFVDPPGTGFSRALHCDPHRFYNHQMDGEIHASFIARYLRNNKRLQYLPPVFLFGESYGGARACMVAQLLQEKFGIFVRGLILISPSLRILRGTQDREGDGNDLPYMLSLPSQTTVAHYYRKLTPKLNEMTLDQVAQISLDFAMGTYNQSLVQGANIDFHPSFVKNIALKLNNLTGIPQDLYISKSLRLSLLDFISSLLSSPKHPVLLGAMDGRFHGPGIADPQHSREKDPFRSLIYQLFDSKLQEYFAFDLGLSLDSLPRYIPTNTYAYKNWTFDHKLNGILYKQGNVLPDLRMALDRDPNLNILLFTGWYDLLVPCSIPKFLLLHGLSRKQLDHQIQSITVPTGHMVFLDAACFPYVEDLVERFISKWS